MCGAVRQEEVKQQQQPDQKPQVKPELKHQVCTIIPHTRRNCGALVLGEWLVDLRFPLIT